MRQSAQRRSRAFVRPRSAQLEPDAPDDLTRAQISQRVKVSGEPAQCRAASLTAMVTRLTSRISSSGIGDTALASIALMTAAAQAF